MQIRQKITPSVIQAATAMLSPYVPEISPQTLVKALSDYQTDALPNAAAKIEKPMTRQQTAELLGVSLPTINRLLNRGTLRRIYITPGAVKVDPASVRALLSGNTTEAISGATAELEA